MKKVFLIICFVVSYKIVFSQQALPVYMDYLVDNSYLLHPAVAGIENVNKIRLTVRKQWFGHSDSPSLQTLNGFIQMNKGVSLGLSLFNDKVGHFSNQGGQLSFIYSIKFGLYQEQRLSFGLSATFLHNSLNTDDFKRPDPLLDKIDKSEYFWNTDVSIAYKNRNFYTFYTAKDLMPKHRYLSSSKTDSSVNLRTHFLSMGYIFAPENSQLQIKINPSILMQYKEERKQSMLDTNVKIFIPMGRNRIDEVWSGVSFRTELSKTVYETPRYLSFFIGGKISNYVLSYTYTHQINKTVFSATGFHQITLGYNFEIRRECVRVPR